MAHFISSGGCYNSMRWASDGAGAGSRDWAAAQDVGLTGHPLADPLILAASWDGDDMNDISGDFEVQWRNLTDTGAWTVMAGTGEVQWATGTDLVDGASVVVGEEMGDSNCSGMLDGRMDGEEKEGANGFTFASTKKRYFDTQWAVSFASAVGEKEYEFRVVDTGTSNVYATMAGTVTTAVGGIDVTIDQVSVPNIDVAPLAATVDFDVDIEQASVPDIAVAPLAGDVSFDVEVDQVAVPNIAVSPLAGEIDFNQDVSIEQVSVPNISVAPLAGTVDFDIDIEQVAVPDIQVAALDGEAQFDPVIDQTSVPNISVAPLAGEVIFDLVFEVEQTSVPDILVVPLSSEGPGGAEVVFDTATYWTPEVAIAAPSLPQLERRPHLKPALPMLRIGHTLAKGLVGAWPVGPWTGENDLKDISGYGAHGTVVGSGTVLGRVVTEFGSAVHKEDADNRRFELPSGSVLPTALIPAFTMHSTVERLVGGSTYGSLFAFGWVGDEILFGLSNATDVAMWTTSASGFYTDFGIMNAGEQNHLTLTWRDGSWEFWANGLMTGSGSGLTNPTLTTGDRWLLSDDGTEYGPAKVSDWRVWDRALSQAEVRDLHMDPWGLYTIPLQVQNRELTDLEILTKALEQHEQAAIPTPKYNNPLNPPRPF